MTAHGDSGSRLAWLGGLRARLAIAIATQVRAQIDQDLRQEATAFEQRLQRADVRARDKPGRIMRAAERYVDEQVSSFTFTSRLYIARVVGAGRVSNLPELSSDESGEGADSAAGSKPESLEVRALRTSQLGFATMGTGAGALRLYFASVKSYGGDRTLATIGVGESAAAVTRAQNGVARTFLYAGTATLLAAIVLGFAFATRLSRPLRRMAATAAEVRAGDLSRRIGSKGPHDEVRVLADAFDRMLDRLEDSFARQRGFVADASHELRTPLTVIRGQLEVLARQSIVTREDVGHVDDVVRTEVLRMERLVDDLLLLARADEGELLRPAPLDLQPFVTELFDALTLTADRRFELGPVPEGTLRGDEDRIAQVVRNLARNAVEHSGPHGLVRLTVTPLARGRVELAIEDDGPGIPPEQRDRIFDRFHRIDTARARREGGAGLGLAIARAIVEAHSGRIYAGVSPEGGARVAFELPGFRPAGRRAAREQPV